MNTEKLLDQFLSEGQNYYKNTEKENLILNKFKILFELAISAKDEVANGRVSEKTLKRNKKAYLGTLNALDRTTGKESARKSRSLRKLIFEMIESQINNSIPLPKVTPRDKNDMSLAQIAEGYLKFEIDRLQTERENDRAERAIMTDGTGWYRILWESNDSNYRRTGDLRIDFYSLNQVHPQPGLRNYKDLEYIFVEEDISTTKLKEVYGRNISPTDKGNVIRVVTCYYINPFKDRIVSRFMWAKHSLQVISHVEDWMMKLVRCCEKCSELVPQGLECLKCGSEKFKYTPMEEEILPEDMIDVWKDEEGKPQQEVKLAAGAKIPTYRLRFLPFVCRQNISDTEELYGISDVEILLENQDSNNKILTKIEDKILKSGTIVTEPQTVKVPDDDATIKRIKIKSKMEAEQFQVKNIEANIQQDQIFANQTYDMGKRTMGISEAFQGQRDPTAESGKAKEIAAGQSAGRMESKRKMKDAAMADMYEIMFKMLIAFCNEPRSFVKMTPDGTMEEEQFNKYMFLDVLEEDTNGEPRVVYKDDFVFAVDSASILSTSREAMWKETTYNFMNGTFGNPADPRVLKTYWNVMQNLGYPLAKTILASIQEGEQHLPTEVEQMLLQNPDVVQQLMLMIQEKQKAQESGVAPNAGGQRPGAQKTGGGAKTSNVSQPGLVEMNNERNRRAGNANLK